MINNKKAYLFVILCVLGLTIISGVFPLITYADSFNQHSYYSIAPLSIPIEDTATGTADVGMTYFRWQAYTGTTGLKYVTVRLIADPTFDRSGITAIKIYFDSNETIPTVPPTTNVNDVFDRNSPSGDDVDVTVNGPYDFSIDDTVIIEVDDTLASKGTNGWAIIYVAFDLAPGVEINEQIGCEIIEVEDNTGTPAEDPPGTFINPWIPTPTNTDRDDVDDYETTLLATGIAPATGEQGEDDVPVLWLQFNSNDADFDDTDPYKNVNIDSITFHVIGTDYSDIDPAGIGLYEDVNQDGILDIPGDNAIPAAVSPGVPSDYLTVNPLADIPFDDDGIYLIATVNVAESAGVDNTLGLEIANPQNDVAFSDIIDDTDSDTVAIYAYTSVEYVQQGYITSTSSTPGTNNTFTITPMPDTDPPEVAATVPRDNESGVVVTTDVSIIFNEDINSATVSDVIFYVEDSTGTKVPGTVSASGSEAIFSPDSKFNYEQIYSATLEPGVEDIYGNVMTTTYTWSFATTANVAKPVAANNRILPGSTDPVQIHIPEPAGGPNERITVQVFTTTGKKVATLVNNSTYAQIENQLPLLWYGKNSQQKNLGPGLYFIQVVSGGEKTVLKVLIVR